MRRVAAVVSVVLIGFVAVAAARPVLPASAQEATQKAACPATTENENEALARRWHEDAIDGADLTVLDELLAADVVHHAGTFPDGTGTEAVRSVLDALLTGFPDVQHTIQQVIAEDDIVIVRWQAQGTHTGEFQGYAPTGKPVTWTGINIFRIECGKIAEEWSEVDGLGRLQQIGVIATPTP